MTGPGQAGPHVVHVAIVRAHGHDAAVTAAEAAAHDALERDEARRLVLPGDPEVAAIMPSGPHAYTTGVGPDADASRRSSGAVMRPRSPTLPSSVVRTSSTPSALKKSR